MTIWGRESDILSSTALAFHSVHKAGHILEHTWQTKTWNFHSNEHSYCGLLGYKNISRKPTFWRAMLPTTSGSSETLVFYHITTWCHNPVDHNMNTQ